ncbi:Fe-S cluster assembly protein SufD [Bacterioplanes sanyensis]|uniref:Fe-S cluster assembly protein SufD n=1 Tax=Bacterioplanes sanyensis TaxID=1249553 RepID=A0A222FP81_9GAMM|nr:Fe-S cluster assembly protein SufD [Bacterioplanes sanyensis]ASP40191.1 Fe-S cluster assembly protein SufD [Bacterioplanes sanyensis]
MSDFIQQHLSLADSANKPDWLQHATGESRQLFAEASIPTRKTELWKYTPVRALTEGNYAASADTHSAAGLDEYATIPALNSHRLVFVNGRLSPELSSHDALQQVTLFSQADDSQQALIRQHLDSVMRGSQRHWLNELNSASASDGVLLHVSANQQLQQPIQVTWLTTPQATPFSVNARLLVVLERGAEATLIEHYDSASDTQNSFTNAVTEIHLAANAQLQHYRLQLMQEDALHIGAVHADLSRDARYHSFHLSLGSRLNRNDLVVNHNEGGSHCEMHGVYVPQHQQLVDFHTCIEHAAAHCTSNEVFRGIMNDKAKAVFNGRIHIHRDAQKTLAELSNKNLLLTNTAEINTKPELEIYADDVKCAHGATVAQLEEKALFYLQSRGISRDEAEVMLSFGFINELLESQPDDALVQYLRPVLARRFGRDYQLSRHLI